MDRKKNGGAAELSDNFLSRIREELKKPQRSNEIFSLFDILERSAFFGNKQTY